MPHSSCDTRTPTTELYTLSLHDALPILLDALARHVAGDRGIVGFARNLVDLIDIHRSEEHTTELQSLRHLVCRLLLEKTKQMHASPAARTMLPSPASTSPSRTRSEPVRP